MRRKDGAAVVGQASDATTDWSTADPDEALRIVARGDRRDALVDFDETLWLRSSTEVYLASLRPRLLAFLVLTALDVLRPWRWLPGDRRTFLYRDWIRVSVTSLLLPWSLLLWRRQAKGLGRRWQNGPLVDALLAGGYESVLVVTNAFRPVVAPLLRDLDLPTHLAVASDLRRGHRVRADGKHATVAGDGRADLSDTVFVTDSTDDADLLSACGEPLLVQWPKARYEGAFADAYLPFLYTRRGKRAGQKYLLHNVLLEDILILCLALAWTAEHPVPAAVAIVLLHCSFWMVYEIGYHENDTLAVRREEFPRIPTGTAEYGKRMKPRAAWAWACLVSLPGALLLGHYAGDALTVSEAVPAGWWAGLGVYVLWLLYLCAARLAFWVYNRVAPAGRAFPYAVLHLFRTLGYGVFLQPTLAGALALTALVFGRWIPYIAYRDSGSHLTGSYRLINLFAMLVLLVAGLVTAADEVLVVQAGVVVAWLTARAHRPLRELARLRRVPPAEGTAATDAADRSNAGGGVRR